MKILWVTLILLNSKASIAQGLYINHYLGYAMSFNGQNYVKFSDPSSLSYGRFSYASGVLPFVGAGYMFNKYVGLELGVGYLFGNFHKSTLSDSTNSFIATYKIKVSSVIIQPSIKLALRSKHRLSPFIKIGLAFAISPEGNAEVNILPAFYGFERTTARYKFYTGMGTNGALGITYKINNQFQIMSQVNVMIMSLYLKSFTTDYYTVNYSKTTSVTGTYLPMLSVLYSHLGYSLGVRFPIKAKG